MRGPTTPSQSIAKEKKTRGALLILLTVSALIIMMKEAKPDLVTDWTGPWIFHILDIRDPLVSTTVPVDVLKFYNWIGYVDASSLR